MPDPLAAERLRAALDLYEVGEAMLRQRLRREQPGIDAVELDARITQWLQTRPGAEHGDHPGPASTRVL